MRTLVVAIPRLEGKCIDNCPTERENVAISGGNRYLVPWGRGIATPLRPQARPERNRRRRLLARRSVRTGLAMTGNLEQSDKHQSADQLMKAAGLSQDLPERKLQRTAGVLPGQG